MSNTMNADTAGHALATSAAVTAAAHGRPKLAGLAGPVAFLATVTAGQALTGVQRHLEDDLDDPRSDDPHTALEVGEPGWFERAWDRVTPWDGSPAMEPDPGTGRGEQG